MENKYKYIDIHTHINLDAFDDDWNKVGKSTLEEGVAYINVGTGEETSKRAIELAEKYDSGVYATVGLHPTNAGGHGEDKPEVFDIDKNSKLAQYEKVVAVGECGFDYYRVEKDTKDKQEAAFIEQIRLANKLQKPLMLHIRPTVGTMDAYEDAILVLKEYAKVPGNVHFFVGTLEIAKQFWDMGFTTSFTGVITFTDQYDEVIKKAPLEMIHAETDAPYVAPVPFRGQRNEPLHVREVYKRIAELKEDDSEKVREQLLENARKLFKVLL